MKKMTQKEFIEAIKSCGAFYADHYEGILNRIITMLNETAELDLIKYNKGEGECYKHCANYSLEHAHYLFELLEERGYYDDVNRI